jgi:L-asparaginase
MVRAASRRSTGCRSARRARAISSPKAEVDFYRVLPPSGYTKGLPADRRSDIGAGDIRPERRGVDFFPYKPVHLSASTPRPSLARATITVQKILAGSKYDGAIWT